MKLITIFTREMLDSPASSTIAADVTNLYVYGGSLPLAPEQYHYKAIIQQH